jgi:hypothetical protein
MSFIASMNDPFRVFPLPNGLSVSVYNNTRRYFGDYFRVEVEIVCRIPLLAEYFIDRDAFTSACSKLGHEIIYSRTEEQMGVPSADIEEALARLVENFIEHALPYVASAQFPGKVVHAELNRTSGNKRRTPKF